ncbi:MAG TPA: YbhB/YbcL family Raf kinase inhibitor-like protein [Patescibacteria group bacterium]|nr:YbhB/YbcL family Raf kinase inhibitor-like protein [Patescibacteria group bacterium]
MGWGGRIAGLAAMGAAALLLACGTASSAVESAGMGKGMAVSFALHSPQWQPAGNIPRQFTCDGQDVSPPLRWGAAPAGTQSLSLLVEDPDAPGGTFIHWVLYDLPPAARELPENLPPEGELPSGARQGRNSFGRVGYGGPCPPPGPAHRYYFRLYALDRKTGLGAGAGRADLDRAMRGHILAQAELMGHYKRR